MANSAVIDLIIDTTTQMFLYMMPVIGVMMGITYITTFVLHVTVGTARRAFRG